MENRPLSLEDIIGPYWQKCQDYYQYAKKCDDPTKFEHHMNKKFSEQDRAFMENIYNSLLANGFTPFELFDEEMKLIEWRRRQ